MIITQTKMELHQAVEMLEEKNAILEVDVMMFNSKLNEVKKEKTNYVRKTNKKIRELEKENNQLLEDLKTEKEIHKVLIEKLEKENKKLKDDNKKLVQYLKDMDNYFARIRGEKK